MEYSESVSNERETSLFSYSWFHDNFMIIKKKREKVLYIVKNAYILQFFSFPVC